MNLIFLKLVNTSIASSWLILAVLLVRIIIRKSPKSVQCLLWALVGLRLLLPFSIRSSFSLVPSTTTIPEQILQATEEAKLYEIPSLVIADNPNLPAPITVSTGQSAEIVRIDVAILGIIWLIGVLVLTGYAVYSWLRLRRRVSASIPLLKNLYLCDDIDSPFILGILKPAIYIPSGMAEETCNCVIAHERAHLQRHDHWWKPLAFLLLTIYWFNPLMWVAYILLCRDIEAACDEKVIRNMGKESVAAYMEALLVCAMHRRSVMVCPVAFGEVGAKERVKGILNYRKPTLLALAAAVALMILAGVFFFPAPYSSRMPEEALEAANQAVLNRYAGAYVDDGELFSDIQVMGSRIMDDEIRLYTWVLTERYDENLEEIGGGHNPAIITLRQNGDRYEMIDYWVPRDGADYASSIRKNFPITLWVSAMDSQRWIQKQQKNCYLQAKAFYENATPGEDSQISETESENAIFRRPEENEAAKKELPDPSRVVTIRKASEIHDLEKAVLTGSYGTFVVSDEETLDWIVSNMSKGKQETPSGCSFSTQVYLFRKDGSVIEIEPAEDGCNMFCSGDIFFETDREAVLQLYEKFGVKIFDSVIETSYEGDIRVLTITEYMWYEPSEPTIVRFNRNGQLLSRKMYGTLCTYTYDENGYCTQVREEELRADPVQIRTFDYRYDLKGKGLIQTIRNTSGEPEEVFEYDRRVKHNQTLLSAVDYIRSLPLSVRQDIKYPEDPFVAIVSPPDLGSLTLAEGYEANPYSEMYEVHRLNYDIGGGKQFMLYIDYIGRAMGYRIE